MIHINKVDLLGRLTRDPEIRYSQAETPMCIAKYSLAVNRRFKRSGEPDCDFINCVAFGKAGEFAEKYLSKGQQIAVSGRIQTGSYEKDGRKIYTTDIVVEEQYFADAKRESTTKATDSDRFDVINDSLSDKDLPF